MQQRKYLILLPGRIRKYASFRLDFEVLTAVKIKFMGPRHMASTSLTGGYSYFLGYSVRIRQKIQVACCSETSNHYLPNCKSSRSTSVQFNSDVYAAACPRTRQFCIRRAINGHQGKQTSTTKNPLER
jgi:hypothetical protein